MDRSAALRSPKGGAFRAKRRTMPTMLGPPPAAPLLHDAPRLAPRVIRRRHPLPFRDGYRDPCAHPFRPWRWLQQRRNLLPAKGTTAILDADAAVPPFANQHLAPRRDIMAALRLQLKIVIRVAHYPVVPDGPLALQPKYPIQFRSSRSPPVVVFRPGRRTGEPPVVFWQIFPS